LEAAPLDGENVGEKQEDEEVFTLAEVVTPNGEAGEQDGAGEEAASDGIGKYSAATPTQDGDTPGGASEEKAENKKSQ